MNKEKLMEKLRKLQDAYDKLFEAVLNSATDEDLQKLNNIEKMVEETKAQIEKLDDKTGKIPGSKVSSGSCEGIQGTPYVLHDTSR